MPLTIRNAAAEADEANSAAERMLEQQAQGAGRDRADDQQPSESGAGVVWPDLAVAQRAAEPAHDPLPVVEEHEQQHDGGGDVGGDEEGEEVVVVLVDVPAEQAGEDHAMARGSRSETARRSPGARRGSPPGIGDRVHEPLTLAAGWGVRRGTGLEPGEDEAADARGRGRGCRASRGGGSTPHRGPGRRREAIRRAPRSRRPRSRSGPLRGAIATGISFRFLLISPNLGGDLTGF